MKTTNICALLLVAVSAGAAPLDEQPTVRAMKDELARSMTSLELATFGKPYYLSYALHEGQRAHVVASLGALVSSSAQPLRYISIDLHVGDFAFDNSNTFDNELRIVSLPKDDDYDAARRALWLATDRIYKHAAETLERQRAVAKGQTKNPDETDSFSKEPPSHIVVEHALPASHEAKLDELAKKLSGVFRGNPDVYAGDVEITATNGRLVFLSSEGSESVQAASYVRVHAWCTSVADDGMPVHDELTVFAESFEQLPSEAELVARVEKLSKELSDVRKAPLVDDYDGPVIFSGLASAQLMRALAAENFAGTLPMKSDRPGGGQWGASELAGKIGQRILPAGTTVIDDPTVTRVGGVVLPSMSAFDDEGMPSQKVSLVEDGRFKRFLMSRSPRRGFEHTNGHAVATLSSAPRAHPMSLFVSSTRGISDVELRKRALAAAKDQGVPYIVVVDKFDFSNREMDSETTLPKPDVMKRVYPDGHEELVRGGTFGVLPLHGLKDIIAIGKTPTVYTYSSGGEAGAFVSIVAPQLLFRDIDVKKSTKTHRTPPIASRPR